LLARGLGRLPLTAKPNINQISTPTALFISTPERVIFVKDAPGVLDQLAEKRGAEIPQHGWVRFQVVSVRFSADYGPSPPYLGKK